MHVAQKSRLRQALSAGSRSLACLPSRPSASSLLTARNWNLVQVVNLSLRMPEAVVSKLYNIGYRLNSKSSIGREQEVKAATAYSKSPSCTVSIINKQKKL